MMDMWDVSLKAIEHSIRFGITIPTLAMRHFRPLTLSTKDLASEAFYAVVETPLISGRGGAAFRIHWQHHVMGILNQPHAPVVIFIGGPLHWITHKFVNDNLIERALLAHHLRPLSISGGIEKLHQTTITMQIT
jgi:hypothetical protein